MEKNKKITLKNNIPVILTFIKYIYSLIVIFVVYRRLESEKMLLIQVLELLAIFFVSDIIAKKNKVAGSILNSITMFFFNAQLLLMLFATSYLSMLMLSNITLVKDVSGQFNIYIPNIIILIVITLFPITHLRIIDEIAKRLKLNKAVIYVTPVILSLVVSLTLGMERSPYLAYVKLGKEFKEAADEKKKIEAMEAEFREVVGGKAEGEDALEEVYRQYFKAGIESGREEDNFTDKPNIIYIMTEGLSKSVIEDPRNIMPNVKEYEAKSLSFTNYYDHSAATYRALIGQLYSGHQYENHDPNKLIGIADILEDEGYKSILINSEPNLKEFVEYLEMLHFNEFISEPGQYEGDANEMSDKEDYELLKEIIEKNAVEEDPYFIFMYTFGTHVNLDSPHIKFGDGSVIGLNRFHNLDHWFGEFMDWFDNAGEITDNTLLVFTTDHATYAASDWDPAFPETKRADTWVDPIPCFFYHKGVTPEVVDVGGRNCINLVPTILDYINVGEDHGNFFLGNSLFTEDADNPFNSVFYCKEYHTIFDTTGGGLRPIEGEEKDFYQELFNKYFAIKNIGLAK